MKDLPHFAAPTGLRTNLWRLWCPSCGAVEIAQKKKPIRCKSPIRVTARCWRRCNRLLLDPRLPNTDFSGGALK